jgi:membrane associated rhomboid family serine protease
VNSVSIVSLILRYPVTAHLLAASVSLSLAKFAGADVSFLQPDFHIVRGEPWRLLSGTLLHGDPLHLFFNVYVMWVFGTLVEEQLGSVRTAIIYLIFAAGSMAAEFAIFYGGIGLSGIAYGLFGMLWVLSHRDPRFAGALNPSTAAFLVFFFLLCIVLTIAQVMAIANVAHAAGAILGYFMGWSLAARTKRLRLLWFSVLALFLGACLTGAFVVRPYVNFWKYRGSDLAAAAADAFRDQRTDEAIELLELAVRMNPKKPEWWLALSSAYRATGRNQQAHDAMKRAEIAAQQLDRRR